MFMHQGCNFFLFYFFAWFSEQKTKCGVFEQNILDGLLQGKKNVEN